MDCERPSPLSLVVSVTSWVNLPDLSNISTAAGPEGAVSVRCSQNSALIQAEPRLGSDEDWSQFLLAADDLRTGHAPNRIGLLRVLILLTIGWICTVARGTGA